ncbi:MAG: hypothetical protein JO060_03795 [Candidatus Eremiobacteraeota bacterium]|nr:hypothetical protein [Candidatus Eremiobacteraeota bacterium]MBV9647866.1 hypothetical protein [Candidatus Eremiobacteraeota bacterium]
MNPSDKPDTRSPKRDRHNDERNDDALDDAVIAADDTGMVRNEAEIVSIEEREGGV